jgi:hypothetical protein
MRLMSEDGRSRPGDQETGEGASGASEPSDAPRRSASEDLADGLELVLRAARKAVRSIDPARIEELGRRAVRGIENLDRKKVGEMGRKAARNLDPRRIEEIAEDAGRELLNVVERVADRVEHAVSGARPPERTSGSGHETSTGSEQESPSKSEEGASSSTAATRKVRVEPPKD